MGLSNYAVSQKLMKSLRVESIYFCSDKQWFTKKEKAYIHCELNNFDPPKMYKLKK
jgi:hypothetical protein